MLDRLLPLGILLIKCSSARKKLEKAAEARQEALTADCLITNLTPYSFDCKVCKTSVALDKSLPYSLNQWDAHKRVCGMPHKRLKKYALYLIR